MIHFVLLHYLKSMYQNKILIAVHFFCDQKKEAVDGFRNENQCLGKNTPGHKLKAISKLSNLSREYTNHSIRATSVTILDECGFEVRHIMCVSGHRSEARIRSYASKTKSGIKLAMPTGLSKALCETLHEADQDSGNSPNIENKNINVDSKYRMQFTFHDCSVNITNNYK